jgi:hypothetical protein
VSHACDLGLQFGRFVLILLLRVCALRSGSVVCAPCHLRVFYFFFGVEHSFPAVIMVWWPPSLTSILCPGGRYYRVTPHATTKLLRYSHNLTLLGTVRTLCEIFSVSRRAPITAFFLVVIVAMNCEEKRKHHRSWSEMCGASMLMHVATRKVVASHENASALVLLERD